MYGYLNIVRTTFGVRVNANKLGHSCTNILPATLSLMPAYWLMMKYHKLAPTRMPLT